MRTPMPHPNILFRQYVGERWTLAQMASVHGVCLQTIANWLEWCGMPRRNKGKRVAVPAKRHVRKVWRIRKDPEYVAKLYRLSLEDAVALLTRYGFMECGT